MNTDSDTVHVDEVHTQVVTQPPDGRWPSRTEVIVPGSAEARWSETRARMGWLDARTRAEGFDD